MNKPLFFTLLSVSVFMALTGCSKKTTAEPVVEPPQQPKQEQAYEAPAAAPSAPQEDPLETERRRLEELMNRIMSDDVYFEFDQATLTSQSKDLLTEVGSILKREPRFTVLTEGHTDDRGTENYNLGLGMRRADAVVQFLINYGIDAGRLTKRSLGKEQPKATGQSEDDYAQNRRAAFRVQVNR